MVVLEEGQQIDIVLWLLVVLGWLDKEMPELVQMVELQNVVEMVEEDQVELVYLVQVPLEVLEELVPNLRLQVAH